MSAINPCNNCRYSTLVKRERELKLSAKNADFLIPSYARFMKLAAGKIKWKLEKYIETKHKRPHGEIALIDDDIKHLHILQGKIDQYLKTTPIDMKKPSPFNACFYNAAEDQARDYFSKNLCKKTIFDASGEKIFIPGDSYKFMYKDEDGNHNDKSENYVMERGQRLPYIPLTIQLSKCILERPYRYDRTGEIIDRMYLHAFVEILSSGSKENIVYMAVIVLRDRKGNKATAFKTAFPIVGEMDLCRRLSGGYAFMEIKK